MSVVTKVETISSEVMKSSPPTIVTTAIIAGVTVDNLIKYGTLIWLTLQIGGWIWDRYKRTKNK